MGTASFRRKLLKGHVCVLRVDARCTYPANNVSDRVDVQVASLCIGSFVSFRMCLLVCVIYKERYCRYYGLPFFGCLTDDQYRKKNIRKWQVHDHMRIVDWGNGIL